MQRHIEEFLKISRVIPVVEIEKVQDGVELAKILLECGIKIIEITLRTPAALDTIEAIKAKIPFISVGAGTILSTIQLNDACNAGADFGVSPGVNRDIVSAALSCNIPYLPGVVTPTEIMNAISWGFFNLKFFPAEASGGIKTLAAYASLLGNIKFCATGGITAENAKSYLSLPNVICVGGSWLIDKKALANGDFKTIKQSIKQGMVL